MPCAVSEPANQLNQQGSPTSLPSLSDSHALSRPAAEAARALQCRGWDSIRGFSRIQTSVGPIYRELSRRRVSLSIPKGRQSHQSSHLCVHNCRQLATPTSSNFPQ